MDANGWFQIVAALSRLNTKHASLRNDRALFVTCRYS